MKTRYYFKGQEETGKIKRILSNKDKGYIQVKDHQDAFFSPSKVKSFNPKEGQFVKFIAKRTGEKTEAINIKLISSEDKDRDMGNVKEEYILPRNTLALIKNDLNNIIPKDNYALWLNKYEGAKLKVKERRIPSYIIDKAPNHLIEKRLKLINNENLLKTFELDTSWRLVVGLGNESTLETSMTFHPIYGFPYIPGQALKGITRNLYIKINQETIVPDFNFSQDKAGEKLEEIFIKKSKEFRDIFGNPKVENIKESAGKVVFFDALPTSNIEIYEDIMNPHVGAYYADNSNKIPPTDYIEPVPVTFLTVKNTTFQFAIGVKKEEYDNLLDVVDKYLRQALTESGVGAKTAVGYGRFNN